MILITIPIILLCYFLFVKPEVVFEEQCPSTEEATWWIDKKVHLTMTFAINSKGNLETKFFDFDYNGVKIKWLGVFLQAIFDVKYIANHLL